MQKSVVTAAFCPLQHPLWGDHFILFPADNSQHILGWEGLVIQAHVLDDILHNPFGIRGIVDGKVAGIAQPVDILTQNPAAGRVEGHGPNALPLGAKNSSQTLLQLVGGLIREGDGDDAPRHGRLHRAQPVRPVSVKLRNGLLKIFQELHILFRDRVGNQGRIAAGSEPNQVGNPVNQNRGFAAAGTG